MFFRGEKRTRLRAVLAERKAPYCRNSNLEALTESIADLGKIGKWSISRGEIGGQPAIVLEHKGISGIASPDLDNPNSVCFNFEDLGEAEVSVKWSGNLEEDTRRWADVVWDQLHLFDEKLESRDRGLRSWGRSLVERVLGEAKDPYASDVKLRDQLFKNIARERRIKGWDISSVDDDGVRLTKGYYELDATPQDDFRIAISVMDEESVFIDGWDVKIKWTGNPEADAKMWAAAVERQIRRVEKAADEYDDDIEREFD